MKNFKVVVLKWTQKFTLVRKAINEFQLKEDLHKEGFSVWSFEEIGDLKVSWNKYYFDILEKWAIRTGTIESNDIFKSYLKIKYEMKYDLLYIYQNADTSLDEKQKIIHNLEEQYQIYLKVNKKDIHQENIRNEEKVQSVTLKEENIDSFQMKKEIEYISKIIEKVLLKLKFLIELSDPELINYEKKEKLKQVYDQIIKVKTSTNIYKLKQIWELWLLKVWQIELEILEKRKTDEMKQLLWETNKLLKNVGSKETFIEKEKDISYIFEKILEEVVWFFKFSEEKPKKISQQLDKQSTSYLRTQLLFNKYQSKKQQIQKEILKKFYIFFLPIPTFQKKAEYLLLRKKVAEQNMLILKQKLTNGPISYTKIVKGYNYFVEGFLQILHFINTPIRLFMLFYGIIFSFFHILIFFNKGFDFQIHFTWIFYFILLGIYSICVHFSKGLLSLIFNFVIFWFLFIVWVINF